MQTVWEMRGKYPQVENILLNLYEYSESMLKLAANNPTHWILWRIIRSINQISKPSGSVTQEEIDSAENGIRVFSSGTAAGDI